MNHFNECIAFEFNPYSYETERFNYTSQLKEIIAKKYESDNNSTIERDICSCSFFKDDEGNYVFKYKAVPATAATSASYSFIHALVLYPMNVLNQETNNG